MVRSMLLLGVLFFSVPSARAQTITSVIGPSTIRENQVAQFTINLSQALPPGWTLTGNIVYGSANSSDVGPQSSWMSVINPTISIYAIPINVGGGNEFNETLTMTATLRDATGTVMSRWSKGLTITGTANLTPGDVTGDGIFNQIDLIQLLNNGHYLAGGPSNFWQGDFDGDGDFDGADLSVALPHYTP